MCVPVAAAIAATALAIEVGGAVADHKAKSKQAKATEREAREAQRLQRRDLAVRQIEEGIATSRRLRDVRLSMESQAGLARASAASAGVQGGAIDALLNDLEASGGRARQDLLDSHVATVEQLERMKSGVDAQADSRIASAPEPSVMATGLRIGGTLTNALNTYELLNRGRE